MRSSTLLSSAAALAAASSTSAASPAAATAPQQLWYPAFASDYEAGRCTTAPDAALRAFAATGADGLVHDELAGCCAEWFPDQERCGCLGGCPADENDAVDDAADSAAAPTAATAEQPQHWYPQFSTSYEAGSCVKAGVNTNEAPPEYYTMEGGFLHEDLADCCARWFGHQENKTCMDAMEFVAGQRGAASAVRVNATARVGEAAAPAKVEAARFVHAAEETM